MRVPLVYLLVFFLILFDCKALGALCSMEWMFQSSGIVQEPQRHRLLTTKSNTQKVQKYLYIFFHRRNARPNTQTWKCVFQHFPSVCWLDCGKIKIAAYSVRLLLLLLLLLCMHVIELEDGVRIFRFGQFLLNAFKLPLVGDWFSVFFAFHLFFSVRFCFRFVSFHVFVLSLSFRFFPVLFIWFVHFSCAQTTFIHFVHREQFKHRQTINTHDNELLI